MGKKNYIDEITDAFGSKLNSKETLKLAQKIKSAQKKAYPSNHYKASLKDRLQSIHIIDQAEDMPSGFSLFQLFGIFTSFVFIIGVSFMMFDIRGNSHERVYHDMKIEKNLNNQDYAPMMETKVIPQDQENIETEQEINNNQIQNTVSQEPRKMEDNNVTAPKSKQMRNGGMPINNEILENLESMSDDRGFSPEDRIFDPSAASSSMMMFDMGETQNIQEMSFSDICREHEGVLSEDEKYCLFPKGVFCESHNIYECIGDDTQIKNNETIEINLEELIEAYGQ